MDATSSVQAFVTVFIWVYTLLILVYVIMSWFQLPYSLSGVQRFLRDVCEERPGMREVVLDTLTTLLPRAAEVFAPPEAESTREFVSYAYHSSQVYGHAYMALKRRMKAIGIEVPPPEELMPGPIDPDGLEGRRETAPTAEPAASRA